MFENFPKTGCGFLVVLVFLLILLDIYRVLETNSQMFLKIMERGGSEFSPFGDGVVLIFAGGFGLLLLLDLGDLLDGLFEFVFGKELVKIHAGVAAVEVGQTFSEELLSLHPLVQGLGVFLLKEDVKTLLVVHLN